jgi:hypothetical protein
MDNGATIETQATKGKNALFMALVTGLAQQAKRKKKMARMDEREPTQEVASPPVESQRDAPVAALTNDIPKIRSTAKKANTLSTPEDELEPMVGSEALQRTSFPFQRTLPPPAPASSPRNISTPSPGRYHKMLSINKLGKEEPQHQIHAKAFREKAYIGPARKTVTEASPEKQPAVTKEVNQGVKEMATPIRIKCDDTFFAELKHRAALQNVTQSLLAENKETVASVAYLAGNDDVSALGSKSFESEKPRSIASQIPDVMIQRPPQQVEMKMPVVKPVELPVKYLDVLPDDEKKDIVVTNMKEFKAPLPFDEDGKLKVTKEAFQVGPEPSQTDELSVPSCEKVVEECAIQEKEIIVEERTVINKTTAIQTIGTEGNLSVKSAQVETGITDVDLAKVTENVPNELDTASKCAVDPAAVEDSNASSIKSDAITKVTFASTTSRRSLKSTKPTVDEDDEVRSFKSLPATFSSRSQVSFGRDFKEIAGKYGSESKVLQSVVEGNGNEDNPAKPAAVLLTSEAVRDVERITVTSRKHTVSTDKANADANDFDDDATAEISIKEITISSSVKGDRSTALASISSKIEHQTRRLAELEADALRKHKEAETAAIDAREALEKMLEVRSKEKVQKTEYAKKEPTLAEEDAVKSKEESSPLGEDYKSIASRSRRSSAVNGAPAKKKEVTKEQCIDRTGDDESQFSSCSTWSEESGLKAKSHDKKNNPNPKTTKTTPKSKDRDNGDYDYQSVTGSFNGNDAASAKSLSERSQQKDNKGRLSSNCCSDASSSQYSRSFDESSCGSSEAGSYYEDTSTSASEDSTYASSYKEDRKVSVIRRKHERNSNRNASSNKRSSSRGRHHAQIAISSRRSKSSSPVEIKKKAPLLPSLMSPDPPSNQGMPTQRESRSHQRSHSQPRSKFSQKMLAKNDMMMSKMKSSNKPNHLLSYSSRRSSNDVLHDAVKTTNAQSAISPETRLPAFSMHQSAPHEHEQLNYMIRDGRSPGARHPSFGSHGPASISLSGYTNKSNAISQRQMGSSPQNRQQQYQFTPNSVPSAPISLAGYTSKREEPALPTLTTAMRPKVGIIQNSSRPFAGHSNFSRGAGMPTSQQVSSYTTGSYQYNVEQRQYQPHRVGFLNSGTGRVNQYSMPSGGELL